MRPWRRSRYLSTFQDGFSSFSEAAAAAGGYNSTDIANRAEEAARAVISGTAAFERDGVTFVDPDPRWPVVAGLLLGRKEGQPLRVLDIGGGLGSSYWQNHDVLETGLNGQSLEWTVVEQPSMVERAASLPPHGIQYVERAADADTDGVDCVLLSSSLQYLDDPDHTLEDLLTTGARVLVIDRTPMASISADIPCVQITPPHIYRASYPVWVLSQAHLESVLKDWVIVARFRGIEPDMKTTSGIAFSWRGLIAVRRD